MSIDELAEEVNAAAVDGTPMSERVIIARLCGVIAHLERRVEVLENDLYNHRVDHPGPSETAW